MLEQRKEQKKPADGATLAALCEGRERFVHLSATRRQVGTIAERVIREISRAIDVVYGYDPAHGSIMNKPGYNDTTANDNTQTELVVLIDSIPSVPTMS